MMIAEAKMTPRTPIQVRDSSGEIRKAARRIAKRHGDTLSGAIAYAVGFCDSAERTEKPPLDYASLDLSNLQSLIVYGCDHYVRGAALNEYLARKAQNKRVTA